MIQKRKPRVGSNQREANQAVSSRDVDNIGKSSKSVKDFSPFAAVYSDDDPRSVDASRVVPSDAKILKIGDATLGYRTDPGKFQPLSWSQVDAYRRRNELHRLVSYRLKHGLDIGSAHGWAKVLSNLVAALGDPVTADSVRDMWRWIAGEAYEIDSDIIDLMAHDTEIARRVHRSYRLLPARETGAAVALTEIERAECEILRIDAWTEPSIERSRRLARERKRKERSKKMERTRNDVTLTYNKE